MRYQDWDVLLFPEGSKAPLQEFRTGCFVIPDPGRSYLLICSLSLSQKKNLMTSTIRRRVPSVADVD